MGYIGYMTIKQMKDLDLFDDIPYKHIKKILEDDDEMLDVEIEDLELDIPIPCWCKTSFTFDLKLNTSGGWMPIMVDKTFVVEKEYNNSSVYALLICNLYDDQEDEEEEEEEEEEKEEEEEEDSD